MSTTFTQPAYKYQNGVIYLAVFLGSFGAHRFYLRQPWRGLFYLIFFWTFIPMFIGIFDGFWFGFMKRSSFDDRYNGGRQMPDLQIRASEPNHSADPVIQAQFTYDEDDFTVELESLIEAADKQSIRDWISDYKAAGIYLPNKVYARAMAFLEGKRWLNDEEYQTKLALEEEKAAKQEAEDTLIKEVLEAQINILLNHNLTTEEQQEQIKLLQKPFSRRKKVLFYLDKHSYWHAMHIIMNSHKVPNDIAQDARRQRQKVMSAFTRRAINEFPLFEVKNFTVEAGAQLSTEDRGQFQGFEFI